MSEDHSRPSDPPGLTGEPRSAAPSSCDDNHYAFAPLLDARGAGELLAVPPSWLLAQARAGRLPHHRLGHYVRFSASELFEWLEANRLGPDPPACRSGAGS